MFSGEYAKAEQAFAGVARVLPLAAVLNNEGVAISRQGHDGTALFRQAVTADPNYCRLSLQPGGEPEAARGCGGSARRTGGVLEDAAE